jgi:hypothetical protein
MKTMKTIRLKIKALFCIMISALLLGFMGCSNDESPLGEESAWQASHREGQANRAAPGAEQSSVETKGELPSGFTLKEQGVRIILNRSFQVCHKGTCVNARGYLSVDPEMKTLLTLNHKKELASSRNITLFDIYEDVNYQNEDKKNKISRIRIVYPLLSQDQATGKTTKTLLCLTVMEYWAPASLKECQIGDTNPEGNVSDWSGRQTWKKWANGRLEQDRRDDPGHALCLDYSGKKYKRWELQAINDRQLDLESVIAYNCHWDYYQQKENQAWSTRSMNESPYHCLQVRYYSGKIANRCNGNPPASADSLDKVLKKDLE